MLWDINDYTEWQHTGRIANLDVRVLDITNCGITSIQDVYLLPNLQEILCMYNHIRYIDLELESLTNINCSYNKITDIKLKSNMLIELICNNNRLTTLDDVVSDKLIRLNCSNNKLSSLQNMNLLQYLNCQNNLKDINQNNTQKFNNYVVNLPYLYGNNTRYYTEDTLDDWNLWYYWLGTSKDGHII